MPLLLLFLLGFGEPAKTIKLQTNGMFVSSMDSNRVAFAKDGTIIGRAKYQIWHWDKDGRLIRRFCQKGSGPGEVEGLGEVYWTGKFYWVIDSLSLQSTVFDANGRYLSRKNLYFRQLINVGEQVFAVDYSQANQNIGNHPRNLQEIRFRLDNNQLMVEKTGLLFYKLTTRQQDMVMNFKLLWVVQEGDTYFVVNQLEPRMYVYDRKTRDAEAKIDALKPFEAPFVSIEFPQYAPPPKHFTKNRQQRALLDWWNSWSRINYFGKINDHFVLAFEVPDPKDTEDMLQGIVPFTREGGALAMTTLYRGFVIGQTNGKIVLFREGDADETFDYYLDYYDVVPKNGKAAAAIRARK